MKMISPSLQIAAEFSKQPKSDTGWWLPMPRKNGSATVYFSIDENKLPFITTTFWKHGKRASDIANRRNRNKLMAVTVFDTKICEIFEARSFKSGTDITKTIDCTWCPFNEPSFVIRTWVKNYRVTISQVGWWLKHLFHFYY